MKILVVKNKGDDEYFDISTPEKYEKIALELIEDRHESGWYYEGEDDVKAGDIILREDGKAAIAFLKKRSDYEYEGVWEEEVRDGLR